MRLVRYTQTEPFMVAEVETLEDEAPEASSGVEALVRNVIEQFQQIVSESPTLSDELRTIAGEHRGAEPAGGFCGFVAALPDHRRQAATAGDARHRGSVWSC